MWFITHTYTTSRIFKNPNPLLIIGSTVPDIALLGYLSFDETHKGLGFKKFLEKNCPEALSLGIGFMLHDNRPTGLDYYSHIKFEGEEGYAFKISKPFVKTISKIKSSELRFSDEEIAHSLIEIAVELLVAEAYPDSVDLLEKSIREADKKLVAYNMSQFFGTKLDESKINKFYSIFSPRKLSNLKGILGIISQITSADIEILEKIIPEAIKITKPTYKHFLNTSIENMKVELKKLNINLD